MLCIQSTGKAAILNTTFFYIRTALSQKITFLIAKIDVLEINNLIFVFYVHRFVDINQSVCDRCLPSVRMLALISCLKLHSDYLETKDHYYI